MNTFRFKNQKYRFLVSFVALLFSFLIGIRPVVEQGLEMLFLLPLTLSVASLLFGDVFGYYKKNIALFIIYFVIALRYLVSPMLISLTGHTVSTLNPSIMGYKFAIVMMIVELFVILISIKIFWKNPAEYANKGTFPSVLRLSFPGLVMALFIFVLLIFRGNMGNVFSHLTVIMNFKNEVTPVYSYDLSLFMALKTFVFLIVASWIYRKQRNASPRNKFMYFLLLGLFAGLNVLIYDAEQRSVLAEMLIATATVLVFIFPKKKKVFIASIFTIAVIMLGVNFLKGTLNYNPENGTVINQFFFNYTSEVLELYTGNVSTMAQSYDAYGYIRGNMSPLTIFSDIVNYTGVITFPGLRNIYYLFQDIPTTPQLFQNSINGNAYIMTTAGLSIYYGSLGFGWIFNILTYVFMVKLIHYLHVKRQNSVHIGEIYVNSFVQILAALLLVNNLILFLQGATEIIFIIFLMIKVNDIGNHRIGW